MRHSSKDKDQNTGLQTITTGLLNTLPVDALPTEPVVVTKFRKPRYVLIPYDQYIKR
jgi:PHD/YefM family antitoxin component YafN of YafNO toxin-antitoxin module